jgi:hypothetical protein
MKLRLENGNFAISLDAEGKATLPTNIPVQQFVGAIVVDNSGALFTVTKVSASNGVITLVINGGSVAYTAATGAVAYTAAS